MNKNINNNMNRSNVTSFSFTVQDDLISQSSANTTFVKPKTFGKQPFSIDYGPKGADGKNHYDQRPVPTIQKKIIEQAQNDAYKELNNQLFNPFQHKLQGGFHNREGDLYQRQKQKQMEMIKKKEMELMNSAKNYTIVFNHNNNPQGRSLQMAANNILQDGAPNIGDYYKNKFGKKVSALEEINEENQTEVKKNNFVADKVVKKRRNTDGKLEKQQSVEKEKLVKGPKGWRRQSDPEKQSQNDSRVSYAQNQQPNREVKPTYTPHVPKSIPKPEPPKPKPQKKPEVPIAKKPEVPSSRVPPKPQNKNQRINSKNAPKTNLPNGKQKYSEVYEGPDRNLVELLERQISQCPNITFDDIAELQTAKGLLQEAVLLPRMMPQFFKGIRKAMKGILLFGPPGTGKTLLAKAIATNNMFFNVSASSLASKWKGQSQKMVRLLFQMARYHAPSVIFFDEIDCIATKRSENEHESTRKVKTELLVQMDGVGNSQQSVFVLAATNRPWDLDQALRRRLEKRIYIPLPGKEGRRKLFDINLKELKISQKIDWGKLVDLTKGCSGADICNICRDAAYMPMRRKLNQVGGIAKISELSQTELLGEEVAEGDLVEAAKKVRPSVGNDDLKRYSKWMEQFGST